MFGILKLETILAAFTKVEAALEAFLNQTQQALDKNANDQSALAAKAAELTGQQAKAQRTLDRVKALTE